MRHRPSGILMLTCATLIWGTALVAQSLGMRHMGPFVFNALRFLIGGVSVVFFLLLYTPARGKKEHGTREHGTARLGGAWDAALFRGGLLCGILLFVTASFQQIGICGTSVGKAGFITALYIMLVPLFGAALGKKPPVPAFLCAITATGGCTCCASMRSSP